jgi:hypothetical protein
MHTPQAWAAMAATLILGATGTAKSGRRQVIPFSTTERWVEVRITTKERGPAFMRRPHFPCAPSKREERLGHVTKLMARHLLGHGPGPKAHFSIMSRLGGHW